MGRLATFLPQRDGTDRRLAAAYQERSRGAMMVGMSDVEVYRARPNIYSIEIVTPDGGELTRFNKRRSRQRARPRERRPCKPPGSSPWSSSLEPSW